jgi:hypothetical protein
VKRQRRQASVPAPDASPASITAIGGRWLLLIHQLPPKPDYFRVKIWRRLQRVGAVAIKNSVYVLPYTDQATEDFQWIREEIVGGGGEASVCRAAFVDGLSDQQIETLFRTARDAEYAALAELADALGAQSDGEGLPRPPQTARLERRLREISEVDHFGAAGRQPLEAVLARLKARPRSRQRPPDHDRPLTRRTWVTRAGVHVDRIASAWLIRRFIDRGAKFEFVADDRGPVPADVLRFDMFEAEYTHEGDRCTFETLLRRFVLDDHALRAIGEMVHDVDCKDGKFGREETPGFERLIAGIVKRNASDVARLERGATLLDDLYESFGGSGKPGRRPPKQRGRPD